MSHCQQRYDCMIKMLHSKYNVSLYRNMRRNYEKRKEIFLSLYDNIQHKDSENPRFKPIKKFCRHIQNKNGFLDLNREHSYNFLFDSIPTIFLFLVTKPYFLIQLTGVVKLVQTQEFLSRKNEFGSAKIVNWWNMQTFSQILAIRKINLQ